MSEIQNNTNSKKGRVKKNSPHLDMTPMVDLAFLLLTFFVLTATFNQSKTMEFAFPSEGNPSPIKKGITFLLSKDDRIFYYEGELKLSGAVNKPKTTLSELNFSSEGARSLHHFLLEKNKDLHTQIKSLLIHKTNHQMDEQEFKRLVMEKKRIRMLIPILLKPTTRPAIKM